MRLKRQTTQRKRRRIVPRRARRKPSDRVDPIPRSTAIGSQRRLATQPRRRVTSPATTNRWQSKTTAQLRARVIRADPVEVSMLLKPITDCAYGFGGTLEQTTLNEAVDKVTAALKVEGFGVLTQIDVRDTLRKKLNLDFRPYLILGACNPVLASKALAADPQIGLLLPCNVVIQEIDKNTILVTIADPRAMFTIVDSSALRPIADEADARLRRVIAALLSERGTV